jgi:putative sigma-54 modulation protein
MDVTIRGNNLKVTDALRDFTETKIERLDRYLPNIREVRVDLSRQSTKRGEDLTIAQITLRHSRGAILRAEEKRRGEDRDAVEAAVTIAVDKMYRQIERFKGKRINNRKGRERFFATAEELDLAEDLPEVAIPEDTPGAYGDFEEEVDVIRRKIIPVSAMNEPEAIEQMELLGHTFFMFLNADTGKVNVLYRRDSGGYGVLVPE